MTWARSRLGASLSSQLASGMARGRPRAFDEREALEKAMQLFWSRGYERTALADLLVEMQISRQSLYDAFGNKRTLFIRAVEHYRDCHLQDGLALLSQDGSPLANVTAFVRFFERLASGERGCLVANAMVEVAPHDEEIGALLRDILERVETAIRLALERARARGELPESKSPLRLSRALASAVIGLAVTGKLRPGPTALRDVYSGTLSMLD